MLRFAVIAAIIVFFSPAAHVRRSVSPPGEWAACESTGFTATQKAVDRSIALIQKSLTEYPKHETCFSCHHQGVGSFALALARDAGYAVDEDIRRAAAKHTEADLRSALASYQKGEGQPGAITRAGYAMLALKAGGAKHDEVTDAVAGFILGRDKDRGFWNHTSSRPPQEASSFTDTFLSIQALKAFGDEKSKEAAAERIERAKKWLQTAVPKDTEDKVFRLWGLKESGADAAVVKKAAEDLMADQHSDGGWSQLPGAGSDAYATGSVLTVLRQTGGLSAASAAYKRGVQFLLNTQQPDGSWHVVSRSKPFQPYFETGFPHGKDQFISMAATGWATSALVLASPSPRQ